MRKTAAAVAAIALLGIAFAQDAKRPVNRKCPLKPDVPIDPALSVVYKGKLIGLCCTDCVEKWNKNPEAYIGRVKADSHLPVEPSGFATAKDALNSGRNGGYLTVLFFADKSPKSQAFLRLISDPSLEGEFGKCAYARVEFKKDSEEVKLFKVTAVPVLLLLDATQDPPKVLKSLTGGAPKTLLKDLQDAAKKIEKK